MSSENTFFYPCLQRSTIKRVQGIFATVGASSQMWNKQGRQADHLFPLRENDACWQADKTTKTWSCSSHGRVKQIPCKSLPCFPQLYNSQSNTRRAIKGEINSPTLYQTLQHSGNLFRLMGQQQPLSLGAVTTCPLLIKIPSVNAQKQKSLSEWCLGQALTLTNDV